MPAHPDPISVEVTHSFKAVFQSVFWLTVFLWVGAGVTSWLAPGHQDVANVSAGFLDGAKLCTGAVAGLLGGKALR